MLGGGEFCRINPLSKQELSLIMTERLGFPVLLWKQLILLATHKEKLYEVIKLYMLSISLIKCAWRRPLLLGWRTHTPTHLHTHTYTYTHTYTHTYPPTHSPPTPHTEILKSHVSTTVSISTGSTFRQCWGIVGWVPVNGCPHVVEDPGHF